MGVNFQMHLGYLPIFMKSSYYNMTMNDNCETMCRHNTHCDDQVLRDDDFEIGIWMVLNGNVGESHRIL